MTRTGSDWEPVIQGWLKEAERQMDAAYERDDILGYEYASRWRQEFQSALMYAKVVRTARPEPNSDTDAAVAEHRHG